MGKIDAVVKKETKYIACWVIIFSLITQAVFLVIGRWDISVLFGNILSGTIGVLNFFLMGITVQKAVVKEEKDAKTLIKLSQTYRMFMVLILVGLGIYLPWLNNWTVVIPLLFPRIAILIRPLIIKK